MAKYVTSQELYHWTEFRALVTRLGIPLDGMVSLVLRLPGPKSYDIARYELVSFARECGPPETVESPVRDFSSGMNSHQKSESVVKKCHSPIVKIGAEANKIYQAEEQNLSGAAE